MNSPAAGDKRSFSNVFDKKAECESAKRARVIVPSLPPLSDQDRLSAIQYSRAASALVEAMKVAQQSRASISSLRKAGGSERLLNFFKETDEVFNLSRPVVRKTTPGSDREVAEPPAAKKPRKRGTRGKAGKKLPQESDSAPV